MLTGAAWSGNVRELATVIERAIVFGTDESLAAESLAPLLGAPAGDVPAVSAMAPWTFPPQPTGTLRELSRAYTSWVLAHTGGNKEQAAAILGIDLSTLYRWQRAR